MEFYRINAQMLPKVNFVDETEIRPPYVHRKRRAGEQILYFIRHGEMHLLEDGKPLILKPGDVCLLDKDRTAVIYSSISGLSKGSPPRR